MSHLRAPDPSAPVDPKSEIARELRDSGLIVTRLANFTVATMRCAPGLYSSAVFTNDEWDNVTKDFGPESLDDSDHPDLSGAAHWHQKQVDEWTGSGPFFGPEA